MFFTNPMVSPVLQLKKSDPREVGPAHASHQLIHYRGFQNGPSKLTFCGSTCRTIGDSFPIRRHRRILFICLSPACVQGLWPWDGSRSQRLRRKGIGFGRRSWGRSFCRWAPGRNCNGTLHLHQEAQGLPRMGWRLEPQLCWAVGPLLVRRASPIMSPQWCQRNIAFTLAIIMSHGDCRCTLWCFRLRIVARGSSGATTSAWRISSNGPGLGGLGEAPLPGFGVWSVAFQM